jgi:hypothetical protein
MSIVVLTVALMPCSFVVGVATGAVRQAAVGGQSRRRP